MKALVIGGTGPTGYQIVERLLERDYEVTIYHTGAHELEFSRKVQHIHGDPREKESIPGDLRGKRYEVAVSTSGRLRHIVDALAGQVRKLVAVTGEAVYDGVFARVGQPTLAALIPEEAPKVADAEKDRWGYMVNVGEQRTLELHRQGQFDATNLRYPYVYGPYAYHPFDWYIVKRALDRRPYVLLEADGLTHPHRGYSVNLAHACMLAIEKPQASGQTYNVGDERVLSLRRITMIIAEALGHRWDVVDIPLRLSPRRNPYARVQHIVYDLSKIKGELGYRDVVPVEEATARYALWLRDHPPGKLEEESLGKKAFDYEEEDRVIARWQEGLEAMGVSYQDYIKAKSAPIGWVRDFQGEMRAMWGGRGWPACCARGKIDAGGTPGSRECIEQQNSLPGTAPACTRRVRPRSGPCWWAWR